ncbi:MAG: phosphotransferase family protein [Candidatus Hodarchaeales archaeon]|jgi:aminoglycoside phosphotransferase (APT) family kinase protein
MDITQELTEYFTKKFPNTLEIDIEITNKITSGWETEIYCFNLKTKPDEIYPYENLVVRIYPHFNIKDRAIKEFKVMEWLKKKNYPVPEVLLLETDENPLNRPFIIMEEIEGRTLREVMNTANEEENQKYLKQFSEIFIELHNLDLTDFPHHTLDLPEIKITNLWEIYLLFMDERLKSSKSDYLYPILDWIRERTKQVEIENISLTHGDFHPDNILVKKTGDFSVLDWSAATPVDYRYDLAWTLVLARLYIGEKFKEQTFNSYREVRGKSIKNFKLFEVIALFRRLSDIVMILTQGSEETGMREDTTYIIRSQKELVVRLQELLYEYTKLNIEIPEELFGNE